MTSNAPHSSANEDDRQEILQCFSTLKQKRSLSHHLHQAIDPLPEQPPKLQALLVWLDALIEAEAEAAIVPVRVGREVIEQKHLGKMTYRLEKIRCGKQECRCANGELHGPYWYSYHKEAGKLKSRYVGKRLKTGE